MERKPIIEVYAPRPKDDNAFWTRTFAPSSDPKPKPEVIPDPPRAVSAVNPPKR